MPVFAERLFVLQLLNKKIKKGKYLLWLAQREGNYKQIREAGKNDCGDGIWMGVRQRYKTFYKYHSIEDIDEMMALYGFELEKKFSVQDVARLYKKTRPPLFRNVVNPKKIKDNIPIDKSIKDSDSVKPKLVKKTAKIQPVLPNPSALSIETLFIEKIKDIPKGPEGAEEYHRVVSHALARIFRGSLRNMTIKVPVDKGVKIIDTVYTNCAEKGFFNNLRSRVNCAHPIVEVKNITGDPTNSEINQLNGELSKSRGQFGMLICRSIQNEERVYDRCRTLSSDRYIIFLTDEDLFELIEYSRDNNLNEINDFMDDKLKRLIF